MAVKDATLAAVQERYTQYTYLQGEVENQCGRQLKAQMRIVELVALSNMLEADKLLLHAYQTGQPAKVIQEVSQLAADNNKAWQQLQKIFNSKPQKQKKKRKWLRGKKSWEIFGFDDD
jgi:hypothetical protein